MNEPRPHHPDCFCDRCELWDSAAEIEERGRVNRLEYANYPATEAFAKAGLKTFEEFSKTARAAVERGKEEEHRVRTKYPTYAEQQEMIRGIPVFPDEHFKNALQRMSDLRLSLMELALKAALSGKPAANLTDEEKCGVCYAAELEPSLLSPKITFGPLGIIDRPSGGYHVILPPR